MKLPKGFLKSIDLKALYMFYINVADFHHLVTAHAGRTPKKWGCLGRIFLDSPIQFF
jgi:hypothetical protein